MTTMVDTLTTDNNNPANNNGSEDVKFSIQNFLHHYNTSSTSIDAHYEIGELLGEGGFGMVFKGKHTKTGALRAIKRMEKDPRDEEYNQEIIKEFEFLKELDHPNVLRAYDMFEDKPHFYIVSDLYGGGDVFDYLEQVGHLPEDRAKVFMNKLLSCIEYLHQDRCMVHRDLKLENVLLDENRDLNDMKLIDFGLALHFEPNTKGEFTDLVGSTSYVAPQVIEGTYSQKCDIWSIGVIAYTLLAGYSPFECSDDGQTLQCILMGRFDFKDAVWDPVSSEAKDFICNLLEYEEDGRPTAQQALTHPWLQQHRQDEMDESLKELGSSESLREAIMGLRHFKSKGCKLKQAACAIMASQLLPKAERETINDDFRFLNRSMGGSITQQDLMQACEDLNIRDMQNEAAVRSIFEEVNYSGTGAISYSEFTIAMMFERNMIQDKLQLVFDILDKDKDGKISNADLRATLSVGEKTCAKMLQPYELDDNGMLAFDKFQDAVLSSTTMEASNLHLDESETEVQMEEEPIPEPVKEEPKPEGLTIEQKVLCVMWYHRFGSCDRATMIRRIKKMGDKCEVTEEQVMQLPWIAGGAMIHPKDINAIMAAEATPDGDVVKEAKHRRRSQVREQERLELEASQASMSMNESMAGLSIKELDQSESNLDLSKRKAKSFDLADKPWPKKSLNPNRSFSTSKPLKISTVLAGTLNDCLTTETRLDDIDPSTGKKQTLLQTRSAQARHAPSIFSPTKKAPDFDWHALKGVKLQIATIEERIANKPNFDWVSLVRENMKEWKRNIVGPKEPKEKHDDEPPERWTPPTSPTKTEKPAGDKEDKPARKWKPTKPAEEKPWWKPSSKKEEKPEIQEDKPVRKWKPTNVVKEDKPWWKKKEDTPEEKEEKPEEKADVHVPEEVPAAMPMEDKPEISGENQTALEENPDKQEDEEEPEEKEDAPVAAEDRAAKENKPEKEEKPEEKTTASTTEEVPAAMPMEDKSEKANAPTAEEVPAAMPMEDKSETVDKSESSPMEDKSEMSMGFRSMDASTGNHGMSKSERNSELEDTVHTGSDKRMSQSYSAGSQRRRGSNIYKPSHKSAETEKMKFPKNKRRSTITKKP